MSGDKPLAAELERLREAREHGIPWRAWGPYLSERQWGTVREDYSANGDAWGYFTHDQARSRAYHWGEDGLAGIADDQARLCFAIALWNGHDPILKERVFGLTNREGNHGEDPKEYYHYLDATPTNSYLRFLYRYPQAAFPYDDLVKTNASRGRDAFEYELIDTGVFDDDRYFDVVVEYAKAAPTDIGIRITVTNRGPEPATLHILPTLWFRNTWWRDQTAERPVIAEAAGLDGQSLVATHRALGEWTLAYSGGEPLFTDNETGPKDAFHRYVVDGDETRGQIGEDRHQGGGSPSHQRRSRRVALDPPSPGRRRQRPRQATAGSRRAHRAPPRRGRRVLRIGHPAVTDRRREARDASGPRRNDLVQAVLRVRRAPVAGGARRRPVQPTDPQ